MYISKEVAAKMEACIKQSHMEVTQYYSQGRIMEVNGGAACFSGFDSFLSQVIGWGFATHPRQFAEELASIEGFYKKLNHNRVDIELCPYVGNQLTEFLSYRGYKISDLSNVYALDLGAYQPVDFLNDDLIIREVQANELEDWAKRVALGFGLLQAREQFLYYARAKSVHAFAAFDNNQIVAGSLIALHGEVGDLAVTSTLVPYRAKGLQKKMLYARLNFAKQKGLAMATVTTEPGTISDLNVQKAGFHAAYTRIKVSLEVKKCQPD